MSEHTPGLWKVYHAPLRSQISKRKIIEVQDGNGKPIIAWGGFDSVDFPIKTKLANAKFIAASPDLLSACESALAMLDELYPADIFTGESGDRGPVLIAENRARLQAAIAKAKGE